MAKTAVNPPRGFDELKDRLARITGCPLYKIADDFGVAMPADGSRDKGAAGDFIEKVLGASAGNRPYPDFPKLGLELKTVSVDGALNPADDVFMSSLKLTGNRLLRFEDTSLYRKIQKILFVFVSFGEGRSFGEGVVAGFLFWRPDEQVLAQIKADWEEIMEALGAGLSGAETKDIGNMLALRTKAMNSAVAVRMSSVDGTLGKTTPKCLCLRREFVVALMRQKSPLAFAD